MNEPLTDEEFDIYKGMRFEWVNAKEWQRLIATVDSLKVRWMSAENYVSKLQKENAKLLGQRE